MRNLALSFAFALLLFTALPTAASAQAAGTWSMTCQNASVLMGTLSASCKTLDGGWRSSAVPVAACNSIVNNDGYLTCTEYTQGTYLQSCGNVSASGSWIYATCPDRNGNWYDNEFDGSTCANFRDIANLDGALACSN